MNRREFIKKAFFASVFLGSGFSWNLPKVLSSVTSSKKTLLNLVFAGGPDLRHLLVPPYSGEQSSYGYAYWSHRWKSHNILEVPFSWENRWQSDYTPVTFNGLTFGIHNKAGWLREQFEQGNVAIISNVYASENRNHSHSLLKLESGDSETGSSDFGRDGWGGRLAKVIGGNVVSMTRQVRLFCNGPHPTSSKSHDNKIVISAKDTRNMGLSFPDELKENPSSTNTKAIMARALSSYYSAKQQVIDETSTFHKFLQHQKTYHDFGEAINQRLEGYPIPNEILALYEGDSRLNSTYFGEQLRNVYDSFVISDILNFRVASLEYGGWDSHKRQAEDIEPQLEDIFGKGRGLDSLVSILATNFPADYNNMILLISGEFGRQLAANGDLGTDHGRGNYMILFGPKVKGGIYGDMFPESEIAKYDQPGSDIDSLTSIERLFGSIADWMQPGSSNLVFPKIEESDLEPGVDFSSLISA